MRNLPQKNKGFKKSIITAFLMPDTISISWVGIGRSAQGDRKYRFYAQPHTRSGHITFPWPVWTGCIVMVKNIMPNAISALN